MPKYETINYIHFDTISSTSTWAKENAHILDSHKITCITAREQTAGRGRFSNKWSSPRDLNLYATLYFCLPKSTPFIKNLAQLLSISCCKTLITRGFSPEIKWPNDILLDKKKVCGVLCETVALDETLGIALGIGLNVNMPQFLLEQISQPATSLKQVSGYAWSIQEILELLLRTFTQDLSLLELEGFAFFHDYYESLLGLKEKSFSWKEQNKIFTGICKGITKEGALRALLPSGQEIELFSGEIFSCREEGH